MLQLEFDTMNFTHLYALYRWNFLSSLLIKCWCHFWTMLDMQLHSCSNLAHVHGYNSDSFRDCVVSLCVFSFLLFLYRQDCHVVANCRYCFYSQAKNQVFRPAGATRCTNSGQTLQDRRAPASAWLCKISRQSVQMGGNAAPKYQKISTFW